VCDEFKSTDSLSISEGMKAAKEENMEEGSRASDVTETTVPNGESSSMRPASSPHPQLIGDSSSSDNDDDDGSRHEEANLNMCSAYTVRDAANSGPAEIPSMVAHSLILLL
jgi:hypothetical protein